MPQLRQTPSVEDLKDRIVLDAALANATSAIAHVAEVRVAEMAVLMQPQARESATTEAPAAQQESAETEAHPSYEVVSRADGQVCVQFHELPPNTQAAYLVGGKLTVSTLSAEGVLVADEGSPMMLKTPDGTPKEVHTERDGRQVLEAKNKEGEGGESGEKKEGKKEGGDDTAGEAARRLAEERLQGEEKVRVSQELLEAFHHAIHANHPQHEHHPHALHEEHDEEEDEEKHASDVLFRNWETAGIQPNTLLIKRADEAPAADGGRVRGAAMDEEHFVAAFLPGDEPLGVAAKHDDGAEHGNAPERHEEEQAAIDAMWARDSAVFTTRHAVFASMAGVTLRAGMRDAASVAAHAPRTPAIRPSPRAWRGRRIAD